MAAERSYHYTIRLDLQRGYGTAPKVDEVDIAFLKEEFETKVKQLGSRFGTLISVIWLQEDKPMPEAQSPIL